MPNKERNNDYTRNVLTSLAQHSGTVEFTVIRELCALYDQFCNCPATIEQRLYIKQRITHYKLRIYERDNQCQD